jgi:hypothetical protein
MTGASHWRSIKQHVLTHGSSRPFSRKQSSEASLGDLREASTSMPAESGSMSVNTPGATTVRKIADAYSLSQNISISGSSMHLNRFIEDAMNLDTQKEDNAYILGQRE